MTLIATVLGGVPIAFATGADAESRNPMGMVVVGGLTLATVLTLFVIPLCYILIDQLCVRLTGRSSASGLLRAQEIDRLAATLPGRRNHPSDHLAPLVSS